MQCLFQKTLNLLQERQIILQIFSQSTFELIPESTNVSRELTMVVFSDWIHTGLKAQNFLPSVLHKSAKCSKIDFRAKVSTLGY